MRRILSTMAATACMSLILIGAAPDSVASAALPSLLAHEVLKGTDVMMTSCPPPGDSGSPTFAAKGTASGPYPGTFSETGYWELDLEVLSVFHANFKIVSGSRTITGSATFTTGSAFAACDGRVYKAPTHYSAAIKQVGATTHYAAGSSTVNIIYGSFTESFRQSP